jgi:cell division septal protein FtsQ
MVRYGLFLSLFIALVIGLGLMASVKVKHLTCLLDDHECPSEVMAQLTTLTTNSLFMSDLEAKATQALGNLPGYQLVSLKRQLPQTLIVSVKKNPALYRLRALSAPETKIVDSQGYLYPVESDPTTTLPQVIISDEQWQVILENSQVSSELQSKINQTITALGVEQITFTHLELSSSTIALISLSPQTTAVLDLTAAHRDVKKLSLVLKGLEPATLTQIQEIDVRYTLPVLRSNRTIPRHDS